MESHDLEQSGAELLAGLGELIVQPLRAHPPSRGNGANRFTLLEAQSQKFDPPLSLLAGLRRRPLQSLSRVGDHRLRPRAIERLRERTLTRRDSLREFGRRGLDFTPARAALLEATGDISRDAVKERTESTCTIRIGACQHTAEALEEDLLRRVVDLARMG
jgi:hypothetical protein